MDQRLYCSRRQRLSDRPELSQLKERGLADGSDMIRHSELTVNQNGGPVYHAQRVTTFLELS